MKKLIFSLVIASSIAALATGSAFADSSCQPIYGGGQTCTSTNLVINKKVQNPATTSYVDTLGINDPHYAPDANVNFQIAITNSGNQNLSKVTVKDTLPAYTEFVSGVGNYDANSKTITFDVLNLGAGETRTFTVTVKAASAQNLPANQGLTCPENRVVAVTSDQASQDAASFCIETAVASKPTVSTPGATTKGGLKVFPAATVTTTPATGPEMLSLLGLLPTGALGYFLRKKSGQSSR